MILHCHCPCKECPAGTAHPYAVREKLRTMSLWRVAIVTVSRYNRAKSDWAPEQHLSYRYNE